MFINTADNQIKLHNSNNIYCLYCKYTISVYLFIVYEYTLKYRGNIVALIILIIVHKG